MKKYWVLLLLLTDCDANQETAKSLSFQFYDKEVQREFTKILESENISFESKEGTISYSQKDSQRVDGVKKKLLEKNYTNPYQLSISDPDDYKSVVSDLVNNKK